MPVCVASQCVVATAPKVPRISGRVVKVGCIAWPLSLGVYNRRNHDLVHHRARSVSGAFGVAVASKFFAVGAICPHGEGGVGALSTQALPNPLWGYRGMRLLREGMPAQAVVDHLVKPDAGAEQRQFHVHDAKGGIAVHTGARCIDWCGHVVRPGISVAGNMLAGPDVIAATAHAFETSTEKSFVRRLIAAM